MDRTGWRLGDPHPHRPAHDGLKGYKWLMFLLAIPVIPRTKTTTTTTIVRSLLEGQD